jgi:hypothetical protein
MGHEPTTKGSHGMSADRFDALADRLAERVAEQVTTRLAQLLDERDADPAPLLDAAQAAEFLGVTRKALYRMVARGQVPARRLTNGPRPRLRFDPRALRLDPMPPDSPERAGTAAASPIMDAWKPKQPKGDS